MVVDEARERELQDFLIGRLPEKRQSAIEQECLRDDRLHNHLLILEDELLADYARGALAPDERDAVERRLLASKDNRQRVDVLASLWRGLTASETRPPAARRLPAGWLAAAAALLVVSAALFMQNQQLQRRLTEADNARAAAQQTLADARTTSEPARPGANESPGRVIALSLTPGLVRSAGTAPVTQRLAPGDTTIELALTRPPNANNAEYRVSIRNPDDEEVWSGTAVGAPGSPLVARVEAARLPAGDYELRLSNAPPNASIVAEYYFGIRR